MTPQNSKTFELPFAVDYYCRVKRITEDKTLIIEVFKTNVGGKRYNIQFEDLIALKAPALWIGPVFDIASESELLETARKINDERLQNLSDNDLLNHYSLYKFHNLNHPNIGEAMYILAGKASIEEKTRKSRKS